MRGSLNKERKDTENNENKKETESKITIENKIEENNLKKIGK